MIDSVEPELVQQVTILYEDDHSCSGRCKYQGRFACSVIHYKTQSLPLPRLRDLVQNLEEARLACPSHLSLLLFLGATFDTNYQIVCLSELILGEFLNVFLKNQPTFTPPQLPLRLKLAEGIASGLSFLHSKNILLRNLHTRSVMVDHDDDYCPKIITLFDHEILDAIDEAKKITKGPLELYWKGPELKANKFSTGSFESDLYSLGVILWELIVASSPLNPKLLFQTPKPLPNPKEFHPQYHSIMVSLLDSQPNNRPVASEVVTSLGQLVKSHPYLVTSQDSTQSEPRDSSTGNFEPSPNYKKEELDSMVTRAITLYSKQEFVAAAKLFDIPAWNGNAKAQYYLGLMHLSGQGRQRNLALACSWFERASEKGWVDAEYKLALLHLYQVHSNFGETKEGGFHNLEKLAKAGHVQAKLLVASCYETGTGVTQDIVRARELYEETAIVLDTPLICYRIGVLHENFTPPDYKQAFQWYQRGAMDGHVHCEYRLALCYHYGRGVTENPAKAMEWYALASRQNHPAALYVIGHKYVKGQGLKAPDPLLGAHYYREAGLRGNSKAQQALAHIYEKGQGVAKDLKLAAFWYQKAAASGDPYAQNNLGRFYQNGIGVAINLTRAMKLYRKSAELGIMQAQVNYARCLEMGLGLSAPDPGQAFVWYRRASDQNSPHALFKLAHCYQRGIGTTIDLPRALTLYQRSASSGYHRAVDKLRQLEHESTTVPRPSDPPTPSKPSLP